jgi:hypothetical protein
LDSLVDFFEDPDLRSGRRFDEPRGPGDLPRHPEIRSLPKASTALPSVQIEGSGSAA